MYVWRDVGLWHAAFPLNGALSFPSACPRCKTRVSSDGSSLSRRERKWC